MFIFFVCCTYIQVKHNWSFSVLLDNMVICGIIVHTFIFTHILRVLFLITKTAMTIDATWKQITPNEKTETFCNEKCNILNLRHVSSWFCNKPKMIRNKLFLKKFKYLFAIWCSNYLLHVTLESHKHPIFLIWLSCDLFFSFLSQY